jgi:hypothetical protein
MCICSVANFDAYYVTRPHRSPKLFVFAAKSTDKFDAFDQLANFLHVFSCTEKEGEVWIEKILLARVSVIFLLSYRLPVLCVYWFNLCYCFLAFIYSRVTCIRSEAPSRGLYHPTRRLSSPPKTANLLFQSNAVKNLF